MLSIIKDWREQRILDQSQFSQSDWLLAAQKSLS